MESPFYELDKEIDQLKRERDAAIAQLEAHHISFGGIQKPLTVDEAITRTNDVGCVWVDMVDKETGETVVFVCGIEEHKEDKERIALLLLGEENIFTNRKDTCGKTWRPWAAMPTYEDIKKNVWEE